MGNGGTKENQNVYFRARKQAAMYNERLSSREGAAEMLGISPSTLCRMRLLTMLLGIVSEKWN